MTSWTDKAGRVLAVMPADGLNPARLVIGQAGTEPLDCARFWLDGEADLAEVAVAMFTANGQPAPVITPRPDIDPRREYEFGPLRMRVNPRARGVDLAEGVSSWHYAPHVARQAAGCLVALADAAEMEPEPGDVERLTDLIAVAREKHGGWPLSMRDFAVDLLRAGVTLPGGDGGND